MPERRQVEAELAQHRCCINFIFFLLLCSSLPKLIVFFQPPLYNPTFYMDEFYVPPALNNTTYHNHTIFFNIMLQNSMARIDIDYYSLHLTFFYVPKKNTTSGTPSAPPPPLLLAEYTIPGFYQEGGDTDMRNDTVVVVVAQGLPWDDDEAMRAGSTLVFRVDLATRVKFYTNSDIRIQKVKDVTAIVEVDSSGRKSHMDPLYFISIRSPS